MPLVMLELATLPQGADSHDDAAGDSDRRDDPLVREGLHEDDELLEDEP